MQCPKCDYDMEQVVYAGIEVDRCKGCKGIWFDMSEEKELRGKPGSERVDSGDPEVGKSFNTIGEIKCPKCRVDMIKMVDNEQPHIWYEKCPSCFGIYFDAGEFSDYKDHTLADFFKDLNSKERR